MAKKKYKGANKAAKTTREQTGEAASKSAAFTPSRTFFSGGFWKKHLGQLLALLVLSFGLYAASLSFGYVLDDTIVIVENIYVNPTDTEYSLADSTFKVKNPVTDVNAAIPSFSARVGKIFSTDSFMGYFKTERKLLEGGRYRPLSLATFAAEFELFGGLSPRASHFINILLYFLTGLLLYRILLGLFPLKKEGNAWFSIAFIATALFLLHPLHTEVVANIKGRDEILALMGSLGALWAAMKYNDTSKLYWAFVAAFILFWGMMAKENAITFVAVIPLTLWLFGKTPFSKNAVQTGLLLVAAFIFIAIRSKVLGFFMNPGKEITDLMNNPFYGMTAGERLATIFLTLGWYIKLLFVPYPLTHDYYPYQVPKVGWGDWRALLSLAFYLAIFIFALVKMRSQKVLSWSILFFLLTLSIVSNIAVSVGTFMNERFLFMPSLAFSVLTAWFLAKKLPDWIKATPQNFNYVSGAVLVILTIAYAGLTIIRVPDWKDRMSLNGSALTNSPNSARAHCFMATALYEDVFKQTTDPEQKKQLLAQMSSMLDRSIEINPNYASALIMKAGIAGETFLMDKQMDKFFHEIEPIIEVYPDMDYINQFMVYLQGRANMDKYTAFCHRIGYAYFFKKRNDFANATKYLNYGIQSALMVEGSKGNSRLFSDIADVYKAQGNTQQEAIMRQKATEAY